MGLLFWVFVLVFLLVMLFFLSFKLASSSTESNPLGPIPFSPAGNALPVHMKNFEDKAKPSIHMKNFEDNVNSNNSNNSDLPPFPSDDTHAGLVSIDFSDVKIPPPLIKENTSEEPKASSDLIIKSDLLQSIRNVTLKPPPPLVKLQNPEKDILTSVFANIKQRRSSLAPSDTEESDTEESDSDFDNKPLHYSSFVL